MELIVDKTTMLHKDILSSIDNKAIENKNIVSEKILRATSNAKSNFEINSKNKSKCENFKEVTKIPRSIAITKGSKLESKEKSEKTKINQITLISTTSEKNSNTTDYKLFSMDFQKRKSHSQMDFQHYRNVACSRNLVPVNHGVSLTNFMSNNVMERSCQARNDFFYFVNDTNDMESDSKIAGMKIFASIMLNAWRKRRNDVKRLTEELNHMKKNNTKIKNQIHVLNSLFKIEQKQNEDLNNRLKRSQEDQQKIQDMYSQLNFAYNKLQEKKGVVENKLQLQSKENEGLNLMLEQTKSELSEIGENEKTLKELYECERIKLLNLENEKAELMEKINNLEEEIKIKQEEYGNKISSKEELISIYKTQLDLLEKKLNDLKNTETQLREFRNINRCQERIIQDLTQEVNCLQSELDSNSFVKRIKSFFNILPSKTFQYLHIFTFYLLPGIPPPSDSELSHRLLQLIKSD